MLKALNLKLKTQPHTTGHKTRSCRNCGKRKPITKFEITKGYRLRTCRTCRQSGKRKRISQCPYAYINNLYYQLSHRRKQTHEFTISKEDLHKVYEKQKGLCAYTGITMSHVKDGTGKHLANISIDRVDNSKGYTKQNIALVCLATNMMKLSLIHI